jgi:hypothetical protein
MNLVGNPLTNATYVQLSISYQRDWLEICQGLSMNLVGNLYELSRESPDECNVCPRCVAFVLRPAGQLIWLVGLSILLHIACLPILVNEDNFLWKGPTYISRSGPKVALVKLNGISQSISPMLPIPVSPWHSFTIEPQNRCVGSYTYESGGTVVVVVVGNINI